jgi:hypothetical protein
MEKLEINQVRSFLGEYNKLLERVIRVTDLLRKKANRGADLPLDRGDLFILRHGVVYPDEGFEIVEINGAAYVSCRAWGGYDGEPANETFYFPFEWLNLTDEELEGL